MATHTKQKSHRKLSELSELHDWDLQNAEQDIRGWGVYDAPGHSLGIIEELLADPQTEQVEEIRLRDGSVLPVESVVIGDRVVYLKQMTIRTPFVGIYADGEREAIESPT